MNMYFFPCPENCRPKVIKTVTKRFFLSLFLISMPFADLTKKFQFQIITLFNVEKILLLSLSVI